MAQYNIYTSGSQLVVELIVTSGDFEPTSRTFKSPSIKLTPNSIKFLESGVYKTALYFEDINEIDGVSPTSLENAFDSISNLIGTLGLQDLTGYATESWVDDNFLIATATVELDSTLTNFFYAPRNLRINSTTNINGTPTVTIKVNNVAYTLGNSIVQGALITLTSNVIGVVNLNMTYE